MPEMEVSEEILARARKKIIVALDVPDLDKAGVLIEQLAPHTGCFKVGLELLTSVGGPKVVEFVQSRGGQVFYDGKIKDIPNTAAGAIRAITRMRVKMCNVHTFGGSAMMKASLQAAKETSSELGIDRPLILGVTALTSLNYDALVELGIFEELNIDNPGELAEIKRDRMEFLIVKRLAYLAQECGLDGVIASAQEAKAIRRYCQPELLIVTPGIRPDWAVAGDQKRILTPKDAIRAGADYLVIGRPITKPPEEIGTPVDAAIMIVEEIAEALIEKEVK